MKESNKLEDINHTINNIKNNNTKNSIKREYCPAGSKFGNCDQKEKERDQESCECPVDKSVKNVKKKSWWDYLFGR